MELLIADTAGIQPYIFGSNRLRENFGASYLVDQTTGAWALQIVSQIASGHCNVRDDDRLDPDWCIERSANGGGIEVIYSGGGNFLALFGSTELSDLFERILSTRVLADAPGLDLVIARQEIDRQQEAFSDALDRLLKKLAGIKQSRPRSTPLAGLSVTQLCRSTGLPAIGMIRKSRDEPLMAVSAEILAKLAVAEPRANAPSPAEQRLYEILDWDARDPFVFPREFADLGATKGAHNYMAVVHADGNGMGKRLEQVLKQTPGGFRSEIRALRAFSRSVTEAGRMALHDMLVELRQSINWKQGMPVIEHPTLPQLSIRLAPSEDGSGRWFLPFRPLVFGGDDVTFVADGRIGLELATGFLRAFARRTTDLPGGADSASACAGVAIVKAGRPFAAAYALAEELCASAKRFRRESRVAAGCMDWHFSSTATAGSLEELRRREYGVQINGQARSLLLRPVAVSADPAAHERNWPVVREAIRRFQGCSRNDEGWLDRRNKTKALRDALRGGGDHVEWFRYKYLDGGELPRLEGGLESWPRAGWHGNSCGYFDAIEIFDRFVPLDRLEDVS